jgi:hypothetical protein
MQLVCFTSNCLAAKTTSKRGGGTIPPTGNGKRFSWLSGTFTALVVLLGWGSVAAQCTVPSSVTATPSTICEGQSTNLNATSLGNTINWYTSASGGSSIGTSASGANFPVSPTVTTTYWAESYNAGPVSTQTFNYTGSFQNFTVPTGVTTLDIDIAGASGGASWPVNTISQGGLGGRVTGSIAVTPGQVLRIYVGGVGEDGAMNVPGAGGFNGGAVGENFGSSRSGGGGGGGSDIRESPYALANRLVCAGAGGGGANTAGGLNQNRGGHGGGVDGEDGYANGSVLYMGWPGHGASQFGGGLGGTYSGPCTGGFGTLGIGGSAFSSSCSSAGGGGGGGYFGGGGGVWGGGGGGSNYLPSGTHTRGYQNGPGQVILSWVGTSCTSATRTSITVTVDPASVAPTSVSGTTSICMGANTTLSASGGSLGAGASYNWYTGICGGTLVGTGNSLTVSPSASTTYYVRAEGTCNTTTCASVTVNVSESPSTSNAGPDQTICSPSTTLAANSPSVGTGTWSVVSGPGTITTPNSPTSTVTGLGPGVNLLTWTISNGVCPSSIDTVTVTANSVLVQPGAISGNNSICSGTTNTYSITAVPGATSYTWTYPSGWSGSNGTNSVSASAGATGGNITVSADNACGSSAVQSLVVTVTPDPVAAFSSTTNLLAATFTDQSSGATSWSWNFGDQNTSTLQNPTHTYAAAGTYNVCLIATVEWLFGYGLPAGFGDQCGYGKRVCIAGFRFTESIQRPLPLDLRGAP